MRPSLCSCQCIAVERGPSTCIRYMPTLRCPVFGSRVMTAGSVMNGAASPGQHVCTGSRPRSTSSPRSTTSWHAPLRTVFGRESAIDFSFWSPRIFSPRPWGGCISSTSASFVATSSSRSTPKARHMRRSVPNWLTSSGRSLPRGRSKRSAGPPAFTVRSTISVISRCGSTSAETRTSSPSRSRSAIHARRSAGGAIGGESSSSPRRGVSAPAPRACAARGGGPPSACTRRSRSRPGRRAR